MTEASKTMIREWLAKSGDAERVARWMARTLRIGSVRECRELVTEATQPAGEG